MSLAMTQDNDPQEMKPESRLKSGKFLKSENLLQGRDEIIILHGDVEYRLRRTSQDKLILTK